MGLLGTAFTVEQAFCQDRLRERHGLQVRIRLRVPDAATRAEVHRIIYEALCLGRTEEASRADDRDAMAALVAQGAQAIILGCTQISLLVGQEDAAVPLFDATAIHARAAAERGLGAK
ncbi:MAG TPA: aspartate/glutamate racemase family protein [Pseudorhodoferax sp.]|nr:aspartate/glutamate racemase family protein [Pseudorhodoferax sp.]